MNKGRFEVCQQGKEGSGVGNQPAVTSGAYVETPVETLGEQSDKVQWEVGGMQRRVRGGKLKDREG